ncbi:uncharacterized protein BT62DRAFT_1004711 [Guyanagaster necrorhizus]|uniref:Uncharacterized protein n=1 Tax=Guyanagaster necrorhizus TaxID=856835 RepID=A0A9P7VVW6_9AGAR|nr:uncharacterized protein BT62DRAFT_1004711 [Guyanagaster necrorhizus MCA 3950]KAG7447134.1 hypothetical protein BT62DRAFT_1004711 [Guyanagaster necrorhizus MCA 3950]
MTLPNLLDAEVVSEPDWPTIPGHQDTELQSKALEVRISDRLPIPSYGDLNIINETTELSSEEFHCTKGMVPMRNWCRDAYSVLASFLDHVASVLRLTNSYHPRDKLEREDSVSAEPSRCTPRLFWAALWRIQKTQTLSKLPIALQILQVYEIVGRIFPMYKVMKVKPRVARKLESGDHDWCTTDQMDVDWISLTYKDLGFLRRAKAYFKAFHVALTYQKFSQRMRLKIVMNLSRGFFTGK